MVTLPAILTVTMGLYPLATFTIIPTANTMTFSNTIVTSIGDRCIV